nr:disease resistance protein RPM1-like [Oryza sativa Japonica Group]
MLSTLDLSRVRIKSLPNEIFNLFNLRFLCLRHTGIEILSEEIGRLQNLEVLDVFNAGLSTIPKVIAKLRKLRYLYVGNLFLEDKYKVAVFTGTRVPEGIVHLTGLHSLQYVESNETILSHLGVFTEIRNLGVANTRTEHFSGLCNSIMKMIHLVHLRISALDDEQVLKVEALRLPPTLSILELKGQLEKESIHQSLSSLSHLHNLSKLVMAFSKLDQDSLYSLQMLHGLCFLHLMRAFEGEKLHFCAESFPKLRTLRVWDAPNLRQIEIEESAMQSLARLTLRDCPELMTIPDGIEHLAALEELHLEQVSEDLIEKLRRKGGEPSKDLLKINYIRKVTVRVIHKNIWERIR